MLRCILQVLSQHFPLW